MWHYTQIIYWSVAMVIERKQYLDELIKKKDNGRIKIITGITEIHLNSTNT